MVQSPINQLPINQMPINQGLTNQGLTSQGLIKREAFDIYDFHYVPFWRSRTFSVLIFCVVVLLLLFLGCFIHRIIKKRREERLKLTPWQWAEKEIAKLSDLQATNKDEFKFLYFSLTDLMKQYLHKRYGWRLEEKTDEEIEHYLEECKADPKFVEDFVGILKSSLTVKFADESALPDQVKKDLEIARGVVEMTMPRELK